MLRPIHRLDSIIVLGSIIDLATYYSPLRSSDGSSDNEGESFSLIVVLTGLFVAGWERALGCSGWRYEGVQWRVGCDPSWSSKAAVDGNRSSFRFLQRYVM